jgi:hypothetical protein
MKKYLLLLSFSIATITTDSFAMLNALKKIIRKPSQIKQKTITFNTLNLSEEHQPGKLIDAIHYGDIDQVERLLQSGLDPNKEIMGTSMSGKPLFFANSPKMVKLFQKYGAKIDVINEGNMTSQGMNLLHHLVALKFYKESESLIAYVLEQGIDAKSLNNKKGNLWDSLFVTGACFHQPEEELFKRAELVHKLGINLHDKNNEGKSGIDILKETLEEKITSNTEFLKEISEEIAKHQLFSDDRKHNDRLALFYCATQSQNKRKNFLNLMMKHASNQQNNE